MDDELSKDMNDGSQSDSNQNHDEIPSWLQGLDNQEKKEVDDISHKKSDDDQWIKEVDKSELIDSEAVADVDQHESIDQELPEWLSEMAQAESSFNEKLPDQPNITGSLGEQLSTSSQKDDVSDAAESEKQVETQPESSMDLSQEPQSDTQPEKGFIEISELEIQEAENFREDQSESLPQSAEESPSEIQETFSPVPESQTSQEIFDEQDSPTRPVAVEREGMGLPTAIQASEPLLPSGPTPDAVINTGEDETKAGHHEVPDDLQQAEIFLSEHKFSDAADIIGPYVDQAVFLPQIQSMLNETTLEGTTNNSLIWELSGDVALKLDQPENAIHAYAKAINALLQTNRSKHQ